MTPGVIMANAIRNQRPRASAMKKENRRYMGLTRLGHTPDPLLRGP
jgi:hypothetical protein